MAKLARPHPKNDAPVSENSGLVTDHAKTDPVAERPVTLADIESALAHLAALIETRPEGEAYWPIFERLEREREMRASRKRRLASAKARDRSGPPI